MTTTPNGWPTVRLSEVLTKVADWVALEPQAVYKEVTIRLWGNGVTLRREVAGAEIASDQRIRVERDQFILSRIDARNGAFGLVPAELDGAVVSSDFPSFRIDPERLLPGYLHWLSKTAVFVDLCRAASEGTTNRVRLKEDRFLATEFPLPPLAEQRRIVARVDALAGRIADARRLRAEALVEAAALESSTLEALLPAGTDSVRLADVLEPGTGISYGVLVPDPDTEGGVPFVRVQDLSIRNPPARPSKSISSAVDVQYQRTRLKGGEVLVAVVGSIGKVGIAPPLWRGANIARAVCRMYPSKLTDRRYLAAVLRSRRCQAYFTDQTRTLAQPTLNVGQLEGTPIPHPPLNEQQRIADTLGSLQVVFEELHAKLAASAADLDAILPSVLAEAFAGRL